MKKPKVAFFATINPGVLFYRWFQFARRMDELGLVESMLFPEWEPRRLFSPDWDSKLDQYYPTIQELISWADLAIVQYLSTPTGVSLVQALQHYKPVYMECDDYFSAVPGYSMAFDYNQPGDRQDVWANRQMIASTGVIATTGWLADQFRKYNPMVRVIPNCIDFKLWTEKHRKQNDRIRIGWVGGATHEGDLKLIKEVLYEILEKYPQIEIHIVSAPPPKWEPHERLKLIDRWVTIDYYADHVQKLNFDIGIAPLKDNYFNRGKSNLRYLEYSSCKIPTVSSNVEPFRDTTAIRCNSNKEWFDSLSRLIEDGDYREREGQKAYDLVQDKFNLDKISLDYHKLILEAIDQWHGQPLVDQVQLGMQ